MKINYFFNSIKKIDSNKIFLTFDDGPNPIVTPKLLEILKKENCKATFFLIGKNADKYPEIVKMIINDGHSIGNHTYSHSNYIAFFSVKRLRDDIKKTKEILERITNSDVILFRVPVGISNPRFAKVINELKLISISWTLRTFDTKLKDNNLIKKLNYPFKGGEIILFHDNNENNLPIIEDFIIRQKENGKQFDCIAITKN